jgi:hypothetical protein
MAQLILTAGSFIAKSGVGAAIGSALSSTIAAYAAGAAERLIFGPRKRRVTGPRLESFQIQSSTEGAGVPRLYGRARLAGQLIWAANFKETVSETTQRSGKGGRLGTKTTTTEYLYSISFAVGLAEGAVHRLGRVWADGKPLDLSKLNYRFYHGTEDQTADPLIEAVEGAPAPAFRGLCYIVFEDMPLRDFGNRIPQLSFELERSLRDTAQDSLENAVTALTLIPGSGEFVYGTTPVSRVESEGVARAENQHAAPGATDFSAALDAAVETFPNLQAVSLIVAWFGNATDAGACALRPGVETDAKTTEPYLWRAGGVTRGGALVVSQQGGKPAYGGTPADRAVIEAIAALKAKGLAVMFHPFILMDVAGYPWRGRIGVGASDKTAGAASKIASFFGTAQPSHFSVVDGEIVYAGPNEWSFRRMILHYARLCALAGGVESFLLGSELIGVTTARSNGSAYPAVAALKALAADVRAILGPGTKISYGADWTEWRGHQPADGSGDVFFHLDPLWSDNNVDFIGVDMYAPRADWREGASHLDVAAGWKGPYDRAYLRANIEGGEGFDWYYASPQARAAQNRAAISDGAYGEPWVFRVKDLRDWWSNAHRDRPSGARSGTPTAWIPQSKPIRFAEFGCAAIDKGANQPSAFGDPKSVESALPYFSTGARDDLAQRRCVEAELAHWADAARNPISSVYGGRMVDAARLYLYAWDARPYPFFPARRDIWGDGANWERGHWLNGRAGRAPLGLLVEAIASDAGGLAPHFSVDASALSGVIGGYALDRPMSAREAIDPLADVFWFDAVERPEGVAFFSRGLGAPSPLAETDLALRERGAVEVRLADAEDAPSALRLAYADEGADYRPAVAEAKSPSATHRREAGVELAAVMTNAEAGARAATLLSAAAIGRETASFTLPPSRLASEPGDTLALGGKVWRITEIEDAGERRISAVRLSLAPENAPALVYAAPPAPAIFGAPAFEMFDLPLIGAEEPEGLWFAAFADPWPGAAALYRGEDAAFAGLANARATMGRLTAALHGAPSGRGVSGTIRIRLSYGAFESVDRPAMLAGANLLAVAGAAGVELLQFETATLGEDGVWTLSGLLRGQKGTEVEALAGAAEGARVALVTGAFSRIALAASAKGESLLWRAGPPDALPSSSAFASVTRVFGARALRPLSPVHLNCATEAGGRRLSWIRRTRIGENFEEEAPLGEAYERYRLRIYDGATLKRLYESAAPSFLYPQTDMTADFGGSLPPSAAFEVVQLSDLGGEGLPARAALR